MGFLLSLPGIGPTAEKARAVMEAQQPKNATEVRSFLGLVGFNSRFLPNLATTAEPLRKLTRHDTPFEWTGEQLSRLLKAGNTSLPSEDEHLFMVATHAVPCALQARDLEEASAADPALTDIRQRLKVNNWSDASKAYKTPARPHLHRTTHHTRHSHRPAVIAEKPSSSARTQAPSRHGQGEDATTREGLLARHRQRCGKRLAAHAFAARLWDSRQRRKLLSCVLRSRHHRGQNSPSTSWVHSRAVSQVSLQLLFDTIASTLSSDSS